MSENFLKTIVIIASIFLIIRGVGFLFQKISAEINIRKSKIESWNYKVEFRRKNHSLLSLEEKSNYKIISKLTILFSLGLLFIALMFFFIIFI